MQLASMQQPARNAGLSILSMLFYDGAEASGVTGGGGAGGQCGQRREGSGRSAAGGVCAHDEKWGGAELLLLHTEPLVMRTELLGMRAKATSILVLMHEV
jgi:hypothetical protein